MRSVRNEISGRFVAFQETRSHIPDLHIARTVMSRLAQLIFVIMIFLIFVLVVVLSHTLGVVSAAEPPIVRRDEWGAKPSKLVVKVASPVPYVIIHHSYLPAACFTTEACASAMRSMQQSHQQTNGWNDIGYNFGIGGDGKIYEGRGFDVEGAHAPRYNNRSIGVCVIGDWSVALPAPNMLRAVQRIIEIGIVDGHLDANYTLLGHRQTRETECPGDRLFAEISTWEHFVNLPSVGTKAKVTATGKH